MYMYFHRKLNVHLRYKTDIPSLTINFVSVTDQSTIVVFNYIQRNYLYGLKWDGVLTSPSLAPWIKTLDPPPPRPSKSEPSPLLFFFGGGGKFFIMLSVVIKFNLLEKLQEHYSFDNRIQSPQYFLWNITRPFSFDNKQFAMYLV